MIHVIFICTGNICRSAMAEGYLKYRLKEIKKENEMIVTSAGIRAVDGQPSTDFANKAIAKYGVNISEHKARKVNEKDIEKSDYILVMTENHKDEMVLRFKDINNKTHLLKEYGEIHTYMDIDDPWGLSFNIYEICAKEIVDCIDKFICKIFLQRKEE